VEKKLEDLIEKIVFKSFPSLYEVEVEDMMKEYSSFSGKTYVCRIKSNECLEPNDQMEIDTEVKFLLSMLIPDNKFRKPSINCFFDCGNGYEFQSTYGYRY